MANADNRPKPPQGYVQRQPRDRARRPATRHSIAKVQPDDASDSRDRTMIEPWVDVQAELDAINRGEGYCDEDYPPAESTDDTGDNDTTASISNTQSANTESGVADLPRTGAGPADDAGTVLALIASGLVAAGVVSVAGSRVTRQQ